MVAEISKALVEMANNSRLGVGEDDMEDLLEVAPEELENELEQACIAEEEARGKETGEEKE